MPERSDPDASLSACGAGAWLAALAGAGLAAAVLDAGARLRACTSAFAAALGEALPQQLVGGAVERLLGPCGAALAATPVEAASDGSWSDGRGVTWKVHAAPIGAGLRLLTLQHDREAAIEARARAQALQERLDLLQELSQAGIFERDPASMTGRWDEHMYRIFGLPQPPPGTPAPPWDEVARMILHEDRTAGAFAATMSRPGRHGSRIRIRRPDGEIRHLHSQWKVMQDEQGRPSRVLGVNTDVSELYQQARQAERLRENLEVALDLGQIALWRHDLRSNRVYFDERGRALVGVPPHPDGLSVDEARAQVHPDDLAKLVDAAEATLRTGSINDLSLRYADPRGGWRHLLSRRVLQRDADGQPQAFVGVLLDESERVEQVRRTIELAQRLEAAAEAARIGLWSSAPGDDRPSWNRRLFELLGLDPAQGPLPLGQWLQRCLHPADRERARRQITDWVRKGAAALEVEFRVVRPSDGKTRWLVLRGDVDAQAAPGTRRVQGVVIDVTEQQDALRQLRDHVERMQLTVVSLGLGTWESVPGTTLAVWDEQMFRLRGVESPRRTVTLDEVASYVHPDERDAVMARQVERLYDDAPWRSEFRVVWPDGTVRWIASRSVMRSGDDDDRRRIGLNYDNTDARLAEQALRERERAVAENRAKSHLMSRISHELRTPLNAVLGFTQLLRGQNDEATRQRWLDVVDEAGRHLLALIDDVLDLSRLSAGELRIELQPVSLAEVVASTAPLVARQAQARDVRVIEPPALPGVVMADPVRLRQVLLNLLSNAVKYNRSGGQVRLTSRVGADWVTLQVSDTGPGIEPAALRRAFEPFNRLGAESGSVEGTGIGLAIVKALVEQMKGRIDVDSQLGVGTEFAVVLPAAAAVDAPVGARPAPAEAAAAAVPDPAPAPAARVLYIEDNAVNALLVRELLAGRPGVQLSIADDGAAGIARARDWRPDLVLVDMQLPDMDGIAVLRALRSDPALAAIPCVALSANAMSEDIDAAKAAGFVDYWTKPIDFQRFLSDLSQRLGRAV